MERNWLKVATLFLLGLQTAIMAESLSFSITKTWDDKDIDHDSINITLVGNDPSNVIMKVKAPFFNDPDPPSGAVGKPFMGLWDYEVVEAFFLNEYEQYLEVELCPHGQHIVLLLNGKRKAVRDSLPLEFKVTKKTNTSWEGEAIIPASYFPPAVIKFNAYAIHGGRNSNRTYEALYPCTKNDNCVQPDFHRLELMKKMNFSELLPSHSNKTSELWTDAVVGVIRYKIYKTWNNKNISHNPIELTMKGFQSEGYVELNVSAPLFNDPEPPSAPAGKPLWELWKYEVFEAFFLNEKEEYLEVEVCPWGQHLVLFLKGSRNILKHSFNLSFEVERAADNSTWHGRIKIPLSYFPPNVTRFNAYANHGSEKDRVYEALYPVYGEKPDYHRLQYFEALDFGYIAKVEEYSAEWKKALEHSSGARIKSTLTVAMVSVLIGVGAFLYLL